MENRSKKKVYALKVGDRLASSGAVVTGVWLAGMSIPSGKAQVHLKYPNGRTTSAYWNKHTEVTVLVQEVGSIDEAFGGPPSDCEYCYGELGPHPVLGNWEAGDVSSEGDPDRAEVHLRHYCSDECAIADGAEVRY